MAERDTSIRRRLLVMASGLLLLVSMVTFWTANLYGHHAARLSYDRLLTGAALQMVESISLREGEVVIDLPRSAFNTLSMAANDRVFYAVTGPDGRLLTGYADLPSFEVELESGREPPSPVLFNAHYSGETVRFLSLRRLLIEADNAEEVQLTLGQTMNARRALAGEIGGLALKFVTLFFVVTLSLISCGIWLVLRPLRTVNTALAQRPPLDLSPLAVSVPKEIRPLLNTINYFMAQLEGTLDRLKRFTGEAAHQLRTPLAGLKYLTQLALEEKDEQIRTEQLQQVLACSDQLSDTVSQLLNRAILAHRFQSEAPKPLSLDTVVKAVCRDVVVWALQQRVEISYLGDVSLQIAGDEFALRQMIRNILENAVKYSPPEATVEVDVQLSGGPSFVQAVLSISDHGPGIPDEEKEQVLDCFYRSQNNPRPGSGIGLAIAREVAEHHGAALRLRDNSPGGLVVDVVFPVLQVVANE